MLLFTLPPPGRIRTSEWILKGLERGFSKYRLYPDDAKFEWLDSDELKDRWKIDKSCLSRCIWNKGLKWYALSKPNTNFPTPDWILQVSDRDVDFNGWKWLAFGKISQKNHSAKFGQNDFFIEGGRAIRERSSGAASWQGNREGGALRHYDKLLSSAELNCRMSQGRRGR